MARVVMTSKNTYTEILGLGVVAVDELIYVNSYPPPNAEVPVRRWERRCGGLTATALVTAARLGSSCAYAGVLGDDELSEFAIGCMKEENVGLTHLVRSDEARPVHSTIIVDEESGTRNIFCDARGALGADPKSPQADVIRSVRAVLIDQLGLEGMLRAARISRDAGIPVIGDFHTYGGPPFAELLDLVDHLIIPRTFAEQVTGQGDPTQAIRKLWREGREVVIVTCGEEGCWYLESSSSDSLQHQPAFRVAAVDTTGCGDVFHGAYASALVRNLGLPERVRFASATAALKATQAGGHAGIPTRSRVEEFLEKNSAE